MRLVIGFLVLLVATPAHAMGTYIDHELVAWSSDGKSVLVHRTTSSSATSGIAERYLLISAGDKSPLTVSFTNTQDPDRATQHVDAAACVKAVDQLEGALAAKKFRGVTLRREQCKTKRDVVVVAADTAREAALSWVATPIERTASARETGSVQATKLALASRPDEAADVSSMTGQLVLVFYGQNGDSSGPAHVVVMQQTTTGYDQLIEDLRGV
jgi:hypothetical protein